jgi:hypothetical protein
LIDFAPLAGYQAMFTVDDGLVQPGDDPLRLKGTVVRGHAAGIGSS